jgi:hypothetical protein
MQQNVITNVEPVIRKALTLTGRQVKSVQWQNLVEPIYRFIQHVYQLKAVPEEMIVPPVPRPDESRSNTTHSESGLFGNSEEEVDLKCTH